MTCLSSPLSPLPQSSSFFIHLSISTRVKLYEPGRAQGFALLKGEFFLPLLPVESRTLGFCKRAWRQFGM